VIRRISLSFATLLLMAATAAAVTVTGTVKNGTTGKPAAGDDVVLLALSQGMSEVGHTKTDASGTFHLDVDDPNTPHLVRVNHHGVNYFPAGGPLRPGMSTVDITVYDTAKKLDGISTTANVLRVQTDGGNLQVLELIAVNNASNPPRALQSERTYEFFLPEGAQVDQSLVQGPGGMPVTVAPVPEKGGKYYFASALKPGETRFEVSYHLPYSGEASFKPRITEDVQHFVVMMPNSMRFEAKDTGTFSPMSDGSKSNIQVATAVKPGADLEFRVSGNGVLAEDNAPGGGQEQAQARAPMAGSGGGAPDNRPGGGLGAPIDAPDPLHEFRWLILAGLSIVVVSGGVFVASRASQNPPLNTADAPAPVAKPVTPTRTAKPAVPAPPIPNAASVAEPMNHAAMLLQGLKEELFQLEVERQQGKISAEEYEKTKAALDQTLSRALARAAK
jgi:hypothetical protein